MFHSVRSRVIAMFVVVLIILLIASTIVTFIMVAQQEQAISDSMGIAAAEACSMITEMAMDGNVPFYPGAEDYDDCREALRSLCSSEDMTYMYVYTVDEQNQTMTYILSVAADDIEDALIAKERPYGTIVTIADLTQEERDIISCSGASHSVDYDNVFGHMRDWFVPIENSNGMFAAASYSLSDQRERIILSAFTMTSHLVIGMSILLVVQLIVLRRHVMEPLRKITDKIRSFSPQSARKFGSIEIKSKDELGEIASAFENMASNMANYIDHIEEMTEERVHVDVELSVARKIQQGIVPASTGLSQDALDVYAFSRPARIIGGDFYDIVQRNDGKIAVVIGDVSGKGIAAAMFMAMSRTMIHDGLLFSDSPAAVLNLVNSMLYESNPEGMFVTVLAMLADPSTGEVKLANAGHMPPVKLGKEEPHRMKIATGLLMGLFDDSDIVDEKIILEEGAILLSYTDGASEAVNANKEFIGETALIKGVAKCLPASNARDVTDALKGCVDGFAAGCEQFDDLTSIVLMRKSNASSAGNDMLDEATELPAQPTSFSAIRGAILELPGDKPAKLRACLACEEAFANIVSYSRASRIWYKLTTMEDGSVEVVLIDDGEPFDPLMRDDIDKQFEELDEGGMGISLIRQLVETPIYRRADTKNILTMKLPLFSS